MGLNPFVKLSHTLVEFFLASFRTVAAVLYALGILRLTNHQFWLFDYKGVKFSRTIHSERGLKAVEEFDDFEEGDVVVATYPKTGTHFLAGVLLSIYAEVGRVSRVTDFISASPRLEICPPALSGDPLKGVKVAPRPRVISTHLPWRLLPEGVRNHQVKVVYCMRNPKDTACSSFPFYKKVGILERSTSWENFLEIFQSNQLVCNDYFDHIKDWYPHRNKPNNMYIYYEDMKRDLGGCVRRLAEFLKVELTDEQVEAVVVANTFHNVKKTVGTDIMHRTGKSGGWKKQFSASQNIAMDEWISDGLKGLDEIKFDYSEYE